MRFRPFEAADLPMLAGWLASPHVKEWWREEGDLESVQVTYGPILDGSDPTEAFIVVEGNNPVGYVQRYRLADNPDWQRAVAVGTDELEAAGIDYLIGDERLIGQGLGTRIIARFVDESWLRYPDVPAIVVDVDQRNVASWRALERVGFRRVWNGMLESDHPSDEGPQYLYVLHRQRLV